MQFVKRIRGRQLKCRSFQLIRTPCSGVPQARTALPPVSCTPIHLTIPKTSSAANASASNNNNTSSSGLPQPHGSLHNHDGSTAPLRLVELPGRGRGLVAARKLNPGELLLVCRPLALVQGQSQGQGQGRREPRDQQPTGPQPHPPKPGSANHGGPPQRPSGAAPAIGGGGGDGVRAGGTGPGADAGAGGAVAAAAGGYGAGQLPTAAVAAASATGGAAAAVAAAAAACSEAALVAELQRLEWGPRQAQILAFLYRGAQPARPAGPLGTGGAAAAAVAAAAAAPSRPKTASIEAKGGNAAGSLDLPDLLDPWASSRGSFGDSSCGEESNSGGRNSNSGDTAWEPTAAATVGTHGSGLTADQLAAVVRLNATGLPSDDVLLAKVYGRPNVPYIGLWPAHAMINHSCAPNAVAVVSGGQLLVRCCSPVPVGGEVCINYSGALGLGPLPLRRALLERNHRFRCTCARCTTEEQAPRELAQLWSDIIMLASQQLQPQLMAAAAKLRGAGGSSGGPAATAAAAATGGGGGGSPVGSAAAAATAVASSVLPALLEVRSQAVKCCGLFEETLQQLAPSPQEALWLQASMYPLYETRARCAQVLAAAAAAAGSEALRLVATGGSAVAAAVGSGGSGGGSGSRPAAPGPHAPPPSRTQAGGRVAATARRGVGFVLDAGAAGVDPDRGAEQVPDLELELERRRRWLSEEHLEALSVCLRLQGAANAGSDMHVQLAARYHSAAAAAAAPGSATVAAPAAPTTPSPARASMATGCAAPAPSLESLLRILRELQPQPHQ